MSKYPESIEMIRLVALALGDLNEHAVYVGGATIPFYLPPQYWPQARATEDVDVVMEVVGRTKNWAQEDLLRSKGFRNDTSDGAPTCRWLIRGLKVDVMSSDVSAFGATNKWYQEGIENAVTVLETPTIRIFNTLYLLGTKIEAFKSRGNGDFQSSKDMEDIISVLEVAEDEKFETAMAMSSAKLKKYLKHELDSLQNSADFQEAVPGAIFNRVNSIEGTRAVITRMENLIQALSF